ncbi:MAG TPA: hypothetical protein ENH91_09400 [Leeuwenhoekiella sp.]|nr:hypothetical protein [Leeuwenhoekiella sp.]
MNALLFMRLHFVLKQLVIILNYRQLDINNLVMIDWIIENKEWLFSGIGVLLISLILKLIFRKRKPEQIQKGGKNSKNYQAGKNIKINKK